MLALDAMQIGSLRRAVGLLDADRLARDDVVAEISQEAFEIGIAGRRGDRAVELEIGFDGGFAAIDRAVDLRELGLDADEMARRAARGGEPGSLDLEAHAQ